MFRQLLIITSCLLTTSTADDTYGLAGSNIDFEELNQEPYNQETLDLDNRILHCPPGSEVVRETIHDEAQHIKINFIANTCIFSVLITTGLFANFFLLAVFQHLEISPMAVATKAEVVANCAYLVALIPLYPVANTYAYTGHFPQYEYAKPYVKTFFTACLEITEFLMIWTFVWMNRIRKKFIAPTSLRGVLPENKKDVLRVAAEKLDSYVSTSVRDELRLIAVLGVIIHLPKFFDSSVQVDNDPCNPGTTIVLRVPNSLGRSIFYVLIYKLIALSIFRYLLPLTLAIYYTYATHHALRASERPEGDSKEKVLREKSRTKDSLTVELDWRMLFFCVCYIPNMFYSMALFLQYIIPASNHGYFEVGIVFQLLTRTMVTIHAAHIPLACYIRLYKAFKQKAIEVYWDKYLNKCRELKKKRQLQKDFKLFEERFNNELAEEFEKEKLDNSSWKPPVSKTRSAPEIVRY